MTIVRLLYEPRKKGGFRCRVAFCVFGWISALLYIGLPIASESSRDVQGFSEPASSKGTFNVCGLFLQGLGFRVYVFNFVARNAAS